MAGYVWAIVIFLVFGFFAAWQIIAMVTAYQAATGTIWQRLLSAFDHSATIFFARMLTFISAALAIFGDILPLFDPASSTGSLIVSYINPKYVPLYTLALGIIFELARRRSGSVAPPVPSTKV